MKTMHEIEVDEKTGPLQPFRCRGPANCRTCAFTKEECRRHECEAYLEDGTITTHDERPGAYGETKA